MPDATSAVRDVVIVGGGVAGLVAAWELRDLDVLVLEADERLGGRVKSLTREPYWLQLGAHLFLDERSITGGIMRDLGVQTGPIRGRAPFGIAMGERVIAASMPALYPLRLPLSLAGRASLIRAGLKLTLAGRRAAREAHRAAPENAAEEGLRVLRFMGDESFADFMGALHPDVAALMDAMVSRVTATMREQSAGSGVHHYLGVNRGAKSTYLNQVVGGSSRFPEALGRALGERVRTGAVVRRLVDEDEHVRVELTAGGVTSTVLARQAIVATPADVAARLAPDLADETKRALGTIPYGPYVLVSLLTNERRAMPWDELHAALVVGKRFNFFTNQANILRAHETPRAPGGSLMLYAGADFARRHMEHDDERVVRDFLDDASAVFPELRGIVEEAIVQRWPRGIPYIAPGRHELQPALMRRHWRIGLAGDYFDYPAMEAAARSARDAALHARAALGSEVDAEVTSA